MLGWPDDSCQDLAQRGHHVLRFDNRDAGLSTHLDRLPVSTTAASCCGGTHRLRPVLARHIAALADGADLRSDGPTASRRGSG